MSHLHWVTRQNKLEIPNDKDEVNTREIHKCLFSEKAEKRERKKMERKKKLEVSLENEE